MRTVGVLGVQSLLSILHQLRCTFRPCGTVGLRPLGVEHTFGSLLVVPGLDHLKGVLEAQKPFDAHLEGHSDEYSLPIAR